MPLPMWTVDALASELSPYEGSGWRVVEAQHRVSTLKLVDDLEEQALLEGLLEASKPPVPADCSGLNYLLSTPFRYDAPYPHGSRFRRAGFTEGVFYASENLRTAFAETAFYRLLFFHDAPGLPWPVNPQELTAFRVEIATSSALDLTVSPLAGSRSEWTDLTDYSSTQDLAEKARGAGSQVIRYESVRDPAQGANLAVLACAAFARPAPTDRQSWRLHLSAAGVIAFSDHGAENYAFGQDSFAADPRLSDFQWERPEV
ncbi:RES family NAD+ phosphorylase [Roseibium aestuarii]|uniref:RES family NAD+ phosphorylase n=1 Tax=Roseibium aestuarii TaxID=2600299 RepID=A0ABW4JTV3_9HYPH|nr:RES family NAD+ phosphorylase [Roseibium aestuarii]